jgi:Tol biopolymer transport system component
MKKRLRNKRFGLGLILIITIVLTACIAQKQKQHPGVQYNDSTATIPVNSGSILDILPTGTSESAQPDLQAFRETTAVSSKPKGKIAYGYNWDIWSIDLGTGEKKRLTTSAGGSFTPKWSPDGEHLAFTSADEKIYIANEDGKQPVSLAGVSSHGFSWSSDGRAIVFENECQLYEITYPEGKLTKLTFTDSKPAEIDDFGSTCDFDPEWSPNGSSILFTRYFYRYNLSVALGSFLYIGNRSTKTLTLALDYPLIEEIPVPTPDPSKAQPLPTEPSKKFYISPNDAVWSPDGKRIAFELYGQIFMMDLKPGGKLQPLPTPEGQRLETKPCWSPDGRWIAFIAQNQQGGYGLWVESIDGKFFSLYTDEVNEEVNPTWTMPPQ